MLSHKKRFLFVSFVILSCFLALIYFIYRPPYGLYTQLSLNEIKQARVLLNDSPTSKYVLFKQLQGAGFNNQAQEILLYHHLALQSSRVYAYQPFMWRPRNELLPLSAFLPGPTRNSIPSVLFHEICPEGSDDLVHLTLESSYDQLWQVSLKELARKEKCVVVDNWILHWNFLASPALHSLWPTFSYYLARHFAWSPQILDIVERTLSSLNLHNEPYIALHIRRGDFPEHCRYLSQTQTGFTTWSTLPLLAPSILSPTLDPTNASSVLEHCYSPLARILSAIDLHMRRKPHLRALHVLHDGAIDHLNVYLDLWKLEAAVKSPKRAARAGWLRGPLTLVTHSGMVSYERGEGDFLVGVDVEIARRAEVFIGNGYSSLSSQIVALRLAADVVRGGAPEDITLL